MATRLIVFRQRVFKPAIANMIVNRSFHAGRKPMDLKDRIDTANTFRIKFGFVIRKKK